MNESRLKYQGVMVHVWISHSACMNESCLEPAIIEYPMQTLLSPPNEIVNREQSTTLRHALIYRWHYLHVNAWYDSFVRNTFHPGSPPAANADQLYSDICWFGLMSCFLATGCVHITVVWGIGDLPTYCCSILVCVYLHTITHTHTNTHKHTRTHTLSLTHAHTHTHTHTRTHTRTHTQQSPSITHKHTHTHTFKGTSWTGIGSPISIRESGKGRGSEAANQRAEKKDSGRPSW